MTPSGIVEIHYQDIGLTMESIQWSPGSSGFNASAPFRPINRESHLSFPADIATVAPPNALTHSSYSSSMAHETLVGNDVAESFPTDWHAASWKRMSSPSANFIHAVQVERAIKSTESYPRHKRNVLILQASGPYGTRRIIGKQPNATLSSHPGFAEGTLENLIIGNPTRIESKCRDSLHNECVMGEKMQQSEENATVGHETIGIIAYPNADGAEEMLLSSYVNGKNCKDLLRHTAKSNSAEFTTMVKIIYEGMLNHAKVAQSVGLVDTDEKPENYIMDEHGSVHAVDNECLVDIGGPAPGYTLGLDGLAAEEAKKSMPCDGKTAVYQIATNLRKEFPIDVEMIARSEKPILDNLLNNSMRPHEDHRPSLEQALGHPFFKNSNRLYDQHFASSTVRHLSLHT